VNDGSKKVLKYDIVSSVSGMLTIDLTVNPLFFNNTTTYTLFVVADGDDVANFVPIDGAYDGFLAYLLAQRYHSTFYSNDSTTINNNKP